MNRTVSTLLALLALPLAALTLASCGEEEDPFEAEEGIILELGELEYRVQLTRFLNPNDPEDAAYLKGVPPAEEGKDYLAVFLRAKNRGEAPIELPGVFKVKDSRGNTFYPVETESVFALEPGEEIPAGDEVPAANTPAASGPVNGAFLLFELPEESQELRPLELEFLGPEGNRAHVELDI